MSIYNLILLEAGSAGLFNMLMLPAMFIVMYFFLLRPQMKKQKKEKQFAQEVQVGDKIVTKGGVHGRIVKMNPSDSYIEIEIDRNTKVNLEKSFISMEMTMAIYPKNNVPAPTT